MNEIISGIYRLQIPIPNNPLGFTNTYLLRGTEGYLLIDAGWNSGEAFSAMEDQLAEIGITVRDINKIVVTHSHGDHFGLVPALKERTEAEVIIHRLERDMMEGHRSGRHDMMNHIEQVFTGNGAPSGGFPMHRFRGPGKRHRENNITIDTVVEGNEVISTGEFNLTVIWTPGHAPGHICLYEPEHKILFGGDHVLPGITPNISLMPHMGDNPLGDFMRSLDVLDKLEVAIVLPAHEETYLDLHKRIEEINHHHRHRNMEILGGLKDDRNTAYQLSSAITWMPEEGGVMFEDLPPMHQRMALLETLAHLRAMEVDGEVTTEENEGVIYYRKP